MPRLWDSVRSWEMNSKQAGSMKHEVPLLDGVPDRAETNELHAILRQPIEHGHQIGPAGRVVDVDVDLLGREGRPDLRGHTRDLVRREGRPRPRPVDRRKFLVGGTARKDHVLRQEHAVELRGLTFLEPVLKGFGFRRNMVHDEVGHELEILTERTNLGPTPSRASTWV